MIRLLTMALLLAETLRQGCVGTAIPFVTMAVLPVSAKNRVFVDPGMTLLLNRRTVVQTRPELTLILCVDGVRATSLWSCLALQRAGFLLVRAVCRSPG